MSLSKPADLRLISDESVATLADDRLRWRRGWVLPQDKRSQNTNTDAGSWHRFTKYIIQKAVTGAVRTAGADGELGDGSVMRYIGDLKVL